MKVLFIGGTGNISMATSRLAVSRGIELYLLNRGKRSQGVPGAKSICADINNSAEVSKLSGFQHWDAVVNWIAYTVADIERDLELFRGKTEQYIFISSTSAYQRPPACPIVTESTPLRNPFWEYSRNKIACEDRLNLAYRSESFPSTIVRPSLTYDKVIPVAIGGQSDYTIADRMKQGKPVVVHGDGTSLWTVTHSEDFAKGLVGLLGCPQALGHAFHITSDEILTWDQIYQAVAEAAGVKAKIVHVASDFICKVEPSLVGSLLGDKAYSVIFDNSKIKAFVPGYAATISFREGMRRAVTWFESDPSRMLISSKANETIERILAAYAKATG
jgi:nucleoside-diphosphate-sugar epimerase